MTPSRTRSRTALAAGLTAVVSLLVTAPAVVAQTVDAVATLRFDLDFERRLLRQELATLERARGGESRAQATLDGVLQQAAGVAAEGADGRGAAPVAEALATAEAERAAAAARVAAALASVRESVRRLALVGQLLAASPGDALPDVLGGRWRVAIQPGNLTGVFDLRQDGTQINGTYRLGSGRAGSLRGTYTGGLLRLDRIDADSGFDAIFEAVMPQPGRLAGTWRPTILSSGGPGGGDWSAVRAGSSAAAAEGTGGEEEPR